MTTLSAAELLTAFPPLAALESAARDSLLTAARPAKLAAGTAIFHPGDACQNYLMVADGEVIVRLLDANGHSILLYRVEAGQTCVLTTACLLGHKAYTAEGVVERDLSGLILPEAAFQSLIASSSVFRQFVFTAFGGRLSEMMGLINEIVFRRIDERLSDWLLQQKQSVIETTHQAIADELGTAREVVSRQLKEWERQGFLSLSRGKIEILTQNRLKTAPLVT